MIVVSDTSPLTYLHQIEQLALLQRLYGTVVIPPAVEAELRAAADLHAEFDWSALEVRTPAAVKKVADLSARLDQGEGEAIVLALELKADLLLIDEATGRDVAAELGIRRTGLLGILLEAKRRGLIESAARQLRRLVTETTFRVHEDVRGEFLRLAGEEPDPGR